MFFFKLIQEVLLKGFFQLIQSILINSNICTRSSSAGNVGLYGYDLLIEVKIMCLIPISPFLPEMPTVLKKSIKYSGRHLHFVPKD